MLGDTKKAIAHVRQLPNGDWAGHHYLEDHLRDVAEMAAQFAEGLDSGDWAEMAGLLHDFGKYREKFYNYIVYKSGFEKSTAHLEHYPERITHSTAGALHAIEKLGGLGYILAYLITGHHGGLPNGTGDQSSLQARLAGGADEYKESLEANIPEDILEANDSLIIPYHLHDKANFHDADHFHIWMRMLFSCLVDADFLDTESYMSPYRAKKRVKTPEIADVYDHYTSELKNMLSGARSTSVNKIRSRILRECLIAAEDKPGIFSLTVPTGGGKTLSSLAFGLKHAKLFDKKRVIYAIPFTSIIDQNASVFRKFLKDEWVLEHHSNLDPAKETPLNRLSSENWDSPVVVTTNVQLFESLFGYKTSRCRKLHNIVNSVIILDEAQQIPRDFHKPITDMMQYMSDHYNVTWVLCTATQPDLSKDEDPFGKLVMPGLENVREIIGDPESLAEDLKRVKIQFPQTDRRLSWEEIARSIANAPSSLTIVNTKRDAVDLFLELPQDGNNLFLSANMCQKHRKKVINQVKQRLLARREGDDRPLRLISTQLIEAGVDLDFPVVFRAMAGLDSIAQAAGRCNREGLMRHMGKVVVFHPPGLAPEGYLRQASNVTNMLLKAGKLQRPLSGAAFKAYFSELNRLGDRDAFEICDKLKATSTADMPIGIQFRDAGDAFSLIDQNSVSVLLPYESSAEDGTGVFELLAQLSGDENNRDLKRLLQPYAVSMPKKKFDNLVSVGGVVPNNDYWVVRAHYCHSVFGLDVR